ncbi:MAG: exonuclease SbcCD subunit D [Candidatus Anstonellaceae archaeon]
MKIAFVSDTHFGYERFEEDAYLQGKEAILSASKNADIILLGGDIFDKRNPNLDTILKVVEILMEAKQNLASKFGKKILAIAGTHELTAKNTLNVISFLEKIGILENPANREIIIEDENGDKKTKILIRGLNGVPEEIAKLAFEKIGEKKPHGDFNIFVFHQTLKEFVPGTNEDFASFEDLPEGYDLYLCGHIHNRREYMNGRLQIPGSTLITQLKDEEQEQKGYIIIDTENKKIEFVPIKTRKFIVKEIEFKQANTHTLKTVILEELKKIVEENRGENPIVKIKLKGSLASGLMQSELSLTPNPEIYYLELDNQLEGLSIIEQLDIIKKEIKKEDYSSEKIEEIGMRFLFQNASSLNISKEEAYGFFKKFLNEEKN